MKSSYYVVAQASRLCGLNRRARRPPLRTFHDLRVGQRPMRDCLEKFLRWHRLSSLGGPRGGRGRPPYL